jgi:hypothetical protein
MARVSGREDHSGGGGTEDEGEDEDLSSIPLEEEPPATFNPRLQLSVVVPVAEGLPSENVSRVIRSLGTGLIAPRECLLVIHSPTSTSPSALELRKRQMETDPKVQDSVQLCTKGGMQVRFLISWNPYGTGSSSAAAAKNLGAREASHRSSWLMFLDPDCVLTTHSLAGLVNDLERASRLREEDDEEEVRYIVPYPIAFNLPIALLDAATCQQLDSPDAIPHPPTSSSSPSLLESNSTPGGGFVESATSALRSLSSLGKNKLTATSSSSSSPSIFSTCSFASALGNPPSLEELVPETPSIKIPLRERGPRDLKQITRCLQAPAFLRGMGLLIWRAAFDSVAGYDDGTSRVANCSSGIESEEGGEGLGSELTEDIDLSIRILAKGGGYWRLAMGGNESRALLDPARKNGSLLDHYDEERQLQERGALASSSSFFCSAVKTTTASIPVLGSLWREWNRYRREGVGLRRLEEKYASSGLNTLKPNENTLKRKPHQQPRSRTSTMTRSMALKSGYEAEEKVIQERKKVKARTRAAPRPEGPATPALSSSLSIDRKRGCNFFGGESSSTESEDSSRPSWRASWSILRS